MSKPCVSYYMSILYRFWDTQRPIIACHNWNLGLSHSRSLKNGSIRQIDRRYCWRSKSIVTMALSCIVFETARYWSKMAIFFIPHLHLAFDAPVRGYPSEYCHDVWQKTTMAGTPDCQEVKLGRVQYEGSNFLPSVECFSYLINVLNHFPRLLRRTSRDRNVHWPTVKIIHCLFYSVCYSNGQIFDILNKNVEIFKYKK